MGGISATNATLPPIAAGNGVRLVASLDGMEHTGQVLYRDRPGSWCIGAMAGRDWYLVRTCCGQSWFLREGLVSA